MAVGSAAAEVRGVLRVGVAPVELTPTSETPVLGAQVDDAVDAYNRAAAAYNQAHGYGPASEMGTAPIDSGALGVRATMVTVAPALEVGGDHVFVRVEAALAFGAEHRSYGLGIYPVNLAVPMRRGTITPYLSGGGSFGWLDNMRVDGEVGAMLGVRVAGGVRIGRRVALEVGYGVYALGGFVDRAELDTMTDYDPTGSAPPPHPDTVVQGGEQRGAVDVSFGVEL
jgi:hypothetical protein